MKRSAINLIVAVLVILTGCQSNEAEENRNEEIVYVKEPNPQKREEKSASEIADNLANLASRVPNVQDATAIVAGDFAIVGIDVDADLDRSRVGSIKYSVTEIIQHDPYGAEAIVVADPDLFTRINAMATEIQSGNPVEGFMDEIAAIVGRVMPEIPQTSNENKSPTEQNDEQLPSGDEEQIDKLQNKQSKNHMNGNE